METIIKKTGATRIGDKNYVPVDAFRVPDKFSIIARLITRDLNNYRSAPTFSVYTKDDIAKFLSNPYRYEKQLRRAVTYIYAASPHFRRLIQYFVGLTSLSYIVETFKLDPRKANVKTLGNNYRKSANMLASMNIGTQIPKILTVALREDVFYGTFWMTGDSVTIQALPSDYCSISSIEENVLNVTFDFSYFDSHGELLMFYPPEFSTKYNIYKGNRVARWIELDAPYSFAIKVNADILDYAVPPFAGILREIYDVEDYRGLKLTKTALENYALLAMKLPMDDDGNWLIDEVKAREFWKNLDYELPEEIGSVLTPMDIQKFGFEKSNTGDTNTISQAEQSLFTAAGVSSLLFNNEKASANALLLSIKADQEITYGVVKSIGDAINRLLHRQSFGKNFSVNFLNISEFNRKEMGDAYLKAATYGFPTLSAYAASQGISPESVDGMSFLETEVLGLQSMFKPVQSSTQMSSDEMNSEGGAPTKDIGEVSDKREANEEAE